MTDQTETEAARKPVEKIDFKKTPVFMTIRQTETRNVIEVVKGDPKAKDLGRAKVEAEAKAACERLGTVIAVLGPQFNAFEPPKPQPPQEIGFDFGD